MQWKMSLSIMHNDAITKHDHNVTVQAVSVTRTVKTSITWCISELNNMTKFLISLIVNGGEIF